MELFNFVKFATYYTEFLCRQTMLKDNTRQISNEATINLNYNHEPSIRETFKSSIITRKHVTVTEILYVMDRGRKALECD